MAPSTWSWKRIGCFDPGSDSKESSTAAAHSAQGVLQIPIEKIKANPQQPRSAMDEEKLNELGRLHP